MKTADVKTKSDAELMTLLADSRKQLAQLAIDNRTKQAGNVKQIAAIKKTVARVLTIRRERELEAAEAVATQAAPAEQAEEVTNG